MTGAEVRSTRPIRAMGPDFPGWGTPDAADHLVDVPVGTTGRIVRVESHGSAPHTRYVVRFAGNLRSPGCAFGYDIELASPGATVLR